MARAALPDGLAREGVSLPDGEVTAPTPPQTTVSSAPFPHLTPLAIEDGEEGVVAPPTLLTLPPSVPSSRYEPATGILSERINEFLTCDTGIPCLPLPTAPTALRIQTE